MNNNGNRQMKLGAFIMPGGHHRASWRHPSVPEAPEASLGYFINVTQEAERGLFDMVFLADSTAPWGPAELDMQSRTTSATCFEPLTLLSALATATHSIGLVATSTTTYDEPYLVARKFASLDLISGGRAGWNLVTSTNEREAFNFGRTSHVVHSDRYARASEFADIVLGLWKSWERDAFVRDRKTGLYFDPGKFRPLNHKGEHFQVKGPLNIIPSPQVRPVIVQAGSSEAGRQLASRVADVVFTVQQNKADAALFVTDIRKRATAFGRATNSVLVMPGLVVVVGSTDAEARDKLDEINDLMLPEMGVALLSEMVGVDLRKYPMDGPLPEINVTSSAGVGRQKVVLELARKENLTIRQLYRRVAGVRAHLTFTGTAVGIADTMADWFENGAADGFNMMPLLLPSGLTEFVDLVVPELQSRGLFRTAYEGQTLRSNLGIEVQ
jgi:FMN-dependent oxidoreductase (nitrilotriacetate monooxygenase family)